MDYGSLANIVLTLAGGAAFALAWLFKLQGDVRVLKTELSGEIQLRQGLQDRIDGFEQRIYAVLERIETKLDAKADK